MTPLAAPAAKSSVRHQDVEVEDAEADDDERDDDDIGMAAHWRRFCKIAQPAVPAETSTEQ